MSYTADDFNDFMENTLKPTDTFQFDCKMCGACCRKRNEPILMTGYDVFRIAQALEVSNQQVIAERMRSYLGDQSHVPVMVLKERLDGSCSLLRKGKCMVQHNKPVVCALFPLGRMYNAMTQEIQYFKNKHSCMTGCNGGKTWTLKEWLEEFHIANIHEESMAWNSMLMGVVEVTSKMDRDKITDEMIAVMGACFYLKYDIKKSYVEQTEENMALLQIIFKEKFGLNIEYNL